VSRPSLVFNILVRYVQVQFSECMGREAGPQLRPTRAPPASTLTSCAVFLAKCALNLKLELEQDLV
jgi:hypothetical protein